MVSPARGQWSVYLARKKMTGKGRYRRIAAFSGKLQ
jgi:hypothetical protein